MSGEEILKKTLEDNKAVIFSKSWCPYCRRAISILENADVDHLVYDLEEEVDGDAVHEAVAAIAGRTSVPQTFISGKLLGGCDDLTAAKDSGDLAKLLDEAGLSHNL